MLDVLLRLYRPNTGSGNYQGDVFNRGRNEALLDVAVKCGVETREGMKARFRKLDDAEWERSEAAVARVVAEEKASRG